MMDLTERQNRVRILADKIEQEIRSVINIDPQPYMTNMEIDCYFCCQTYSRLTVRIVDDPMKLCDNGVPACFDCIQEKRLKISDSELALDFEARTIAITRIKSSTTMGEFDEEHFVEK